MKKWIEIIFLFFICASCTKDKAVAPLPGGDCLNYSDLPYNPHEVSVNGDTVNNSWAYFNPNDPNEFVYYHGNSVLNKGSMRIFNLQTNTYTTIYSGTVWTRPVWSTTNWIAFGLYQQLFKIKSAGDSLLQLSNYGENYYPAWSPDARQLVFVYRNPENNEFVMLADSSGKHLDSIPDYWFGAGDWNIENEIAFLPSSESKDVVIINADSFRIAATLNNLSTSRIGDVKWIPYTQDILWLCQSGIYRTNTLSGLTTQIKQGCDFNDYWALSISSDGQKILASVFRQKFIDIDTIAVFSEIRIMNIDGSDEQTIQFPY